MREIPSGEAFLRAERAKLGPLRPNERRVLFVFAVMVLLFIAADARRPCPLAASIRPRRAVNRALPIWVVPPAVMFLLFTIRSDGARCALC